MPVPGIGVGTVFDSIAGAALGPGAAPVGGAGVAARDKPPQPVVLEPVEPDPRLKPCKLLLPAVFALDGEPKHPFDADPPNGFCKVVCVVVTRFEFELVVLLEPVEPLAPLAPPDGAPQAVKAIVSAAVLRTMKRMHAVYPASR